MRRSIALRAEPNRSGTSMVIGAGENWTRSDREVGTQDRGPKSVMTSIVLQMSDS